MDFKDFEKIKIDTQDAQIHVAVGGDGPALVLLHGYPETHLMWRKIAPRLAENYTVICPDLRGYGDSSAPDSSNTHAPYSKRQMANDQIQVLNTLGFENFFLVGHDRGGRVAHRLALDYPARVKKMALLDILPTRFIYLSTDQEVATAYYHWFFFIQPAPLPERLIEANVEFFFSNCMDRWIFKKECIDDSARDAYFEAFRRPATIHANCEDYRASASIDLEHDATDRDIKVSCPVLVLWAERGLNHKKFDVLAVWRDYAERVTGRPISDCGHFLPEEQPDVVLHELLEFFGSLSS